MQIDELLLKTIANIPIVAFALWVYHRESARVDKKDSVILELSKEVSAGMTKVSDNLAALSKSIEKLDQAIEAILRR